MTKEEKIKFVNGIIDNVKEEILNKVDKMPENWDGIELRFYVKDCFSTIVWSDVANKRKKRYKDYANYCIINDL